MDAVGSCIGNKGVRVNAVVAELGGEKIDVIEYCDDPIEYIARALSPAQVLMVSINEEEKNAKVIVPDENFRLQSAEAVKTLVLRQNLPAGR